MDDASKENSPGCGIGSSSDQQQQDWQLRATFVKKEHMFDKVVTPSDVGKLNRLVIPKQHAEKYFPLDATANQKGLLLSFEDRTGKTWRFRYSYWNSSQSYVMTKGWSRFVKEKRLDAGDTVSFGRGVGEAGRDHLFIDWRRRPEPFADPTRLLRLPLPCHTYYQYTHYDPSSMQVSFAAGSTTPWISGAHLLEPSPAPVATVHEDQYYRNLNFGYNNLHAAGPSNQCLYPRPIAPPPQLPVVQVGSRCIPYAADDEGGDSPPPMVFESVAASEASSATDKRVRLFGVYLDCSVLVPETDAEGEAAAYETSPEQLPAALPSPQLSIVSSNSFESQSKDKQPMSLDLEM